MIKKRVNSYIIKPYKMVNDYCFDTTRKEIESKYGEASRIVIDNIMKEIIEYRMAAELIYINDKLSSIVLNKHTNPIINDIEIFYDPDAIEKLACLSSVIKSDDLRYCIYPDLGICVGGLYEKKIPEGKLITAFSESRKRFYTEFFPVV